MLQILDAKVPVLIPLLSDQQREHIKSILQPGDIMLKDDNTHPVGQITNRFGGSRWSHTVLYIGGNYIVDVGTKPYVAKIDLDEFLNCSDLTVLRPRYSTKDDMESEVRFIEASMGRPLNRTFDLRNSDSFYCAQLAYCALKQMPNPIHIPTIKVLGREFVTSTCIENCSQIERIWIHRTSPLRKIIGQAPILLPGIIGATACAFFGLVPALLGFFCGVAVAMFLGNQYVRTKK